MCEDFALSSLEMWRKRSFVSVEYSGQRESRGKLSTGEERVTATQLLTQLGLNPTYLAPLRTINIAVSKGFERQLDHLIFNSDI